MMCKNKVEHKIKLFALLLTFFVSNFVYAQNASVNGTTIGGNSSTIISKPCAIIINATDKELDQMSKTNGKGDIETVNDNANLSIGIIRSYLDSIGISTIEKDAKGELKFKLADGKIYMLNIDKLYWNIFIFNGENTPTKLTMEDYRRQFTNYMKTEK